MTDRTPPSAVVVWIEGFSLCVRIPRSHTIRLPLNTFRGETNVGYEIFLNLLRERERGSGKIGTKFAPVQYDVEKAIREYGKPVKVAKPRPGTPEQRALAKSIVARLIGVKT